METRANAGVSLRPEIVAQFPDHWPAGVAPARDGRIFLSFPRVEGAPAPATLTELIDGVAAPFPDDLVNALDPNDAPHRFVSVHGITLGPGNRLLALDTGARSFDGCDPAAAKLFVIDLERNAIVRAIGFGRDVCLATSYLNDVVIDYDRGKAGYAYISDSSARGPNGIIVVDLDSGRSWRRLSGDPSVRAAQTQGFELKTVDGQARNSTGIDGIALSPDARTLWWTPLGSYELYSIATDALVDESFDALALPRHVIRHEPRRFATDGLDCDRQGRLYLTDGTNGTLQRYLPDESRYEMLLHGSGYFVWPDSIKLGPDRIVYVTDSQVSRLPAWTGGVDRRQPPFTLYRAAIDGDPAQY